MGIYKIRPGEGCEKAPSNRTGIIGRDRKEGNQSEGSAILPQLDTVSGVDNPISNSI